AFVSAAFLVSGLVRHILVEPARASITDHLDKLPLALVVALAASVAIAQILAALNTQLTRAITRRQDAGAYGRALAPRGTIQRFLALLPCQLRGPPLTGVRIISAAAFPLTPLPVISAMFTAQLLGNPRPNKPDRWHHWRLGLMNVMQICVGYMVGAAMLFPLAEQHAWMLSDSEGVLRELGTHLELTFLALGMS